LAAALGALCVCSLPLFAQQAGKATVEQPKSSAGAGTPALQPATPKAANVTDPADLEAFFDGVITVQRESKHIAGAVVAVVVGDKVVFTKGYGYGDVAARRPVDPEKTMFRIASITKLFTWTAVMQQVEEGKLDLNADVNNYLKDVKIPAGFEQPVTLKHLLTHTLGFDDYVIGLFAKKSEEVHPLAEVLKAQMPTRVRAPGVLASYSNHGTAFAGYAVASVSGMPWEEYVEQRILKPLAMEHTLTRQPAEDKLPADMSKGYEWKDGRFKEQEFEYVPAAPAGCMSTTAADASRFMLAHLNDGQLGGGSILKPETARQMREPLFQPDPKTSAICYGFMEQKRNGLRMIGHGGDTIWFHSLMQLIPERRVGLFVSYNTNTSDDAREPLFESFLRRYFPQPDPPRITPPSDFHERARRFAGEYGMTRYSHSTFTKLAALLAVFKVAANKDDTLTISVGDSSRRYVEVEPLVFRELDGPRKVVFQEGKNGRVLYLLPANAPVVCAIRREWYELSLVQFGLLGGSMAVFLAAFTFWPVLGFSLRGLRSPRIRRTWFSGLLSFLGWLTSAACLALAAGMALVVSEPNDIAFGLTPLVKYLLAGTQVCAVLAGLTVLGCLLAWLKGYWRFSGRLFYTLVALAGVGFTWFLHNWNLLTWGLKDVL
jgi:CubicO group peptidase (beta-lactamase class C family)